MRNHEHERVEIEASRLWRRAHPFLYLYEVACPACGAVEDLPAVEPGLTMVECDICGEQVPVTARFPHLSGDGFWLFPAE